MLKPGGMRPQDSYEASNTRATFAGMPSRGSGPPSSAIMTGSQRIRT